MYTYAIQFYDKHNIDIILCINSI